MFTTQNDVWLELLDALGRRSTLVLRLRLDTVEIVCPGSGCRVVDRTDLRRWLADPVGDVRVDDLTLSLADGSIVVAVEGGADRRVTSPLAVVELTGRV